MMETTKTEVLETRLDALDKVLGEIKGITQATHDQAIKTNGRVNRLEEYKENHTDESDRWKDNTTKTVNTLSAKMNIFIGGVVLLGSILSILATVLIKMSDTYISSLKSEISSSVILALRNDASICK